MEANKEKKKVEQNTKYHKWHKNQKCHKWELCSAKKKRDKMGKIVRTISAKLKDIKP